MKKSIITAIAVFGLLSANCFAQDVHFSQFYESPLTMNPALCGMYNGDILAELNYKNQWGTVMGSGYGFNTFEAAFQIHNIAKKWSKAYLSPGLNVYSDKSGDAQIGETEVNLTLASGVHLDSKNNLALGLQAGFAQHSINTSNLQWPNQYSSSAVATGGWGGSGIGGDPIAGNSFSYADFSAGLAWNYSTSATNMTSNDHLRINAGIAAFHLNQPSMSYYGNYDPSMAGVKEYMRYVGHGLIEYGIPNTNVQLVPSIVYYLQGPAQETDFGIKVRYILKQDSKYTGNIKGMAFDIGGYYRLGDAFIPFVQLEMGSYAIGINYDVNVSSLDQATSGAGGIEISLRFINPNPFGSGSHSNTRSMF